jgi:hypothetical protein
MRTCKRLSKQRTSTPLECALMKNRGGGGYLLCQRFRYCASEPTLPADGGATPPRVQIPRGLCYTAPSAIAAIEKTRAAIRHDRPRPPEPPGNYSELWRCCAAPPRTGAC